MIARRTLIIAGLALGLFFALPPSPVAAADDDAAAKQFVETLAQRAIDTVAAKNVDDETRVKNFRTLFVGAFDLPEISKFVLGRYWRTATPEQQQEFGRLFEDVTVLSWAKRFKEYSGEHLQVLGVTKDGERGLVVESQINRPQAPPVPVQWRLRQPDGGFKVVDLIVEGVSMAITYRSDYSSVVQSFAGNLDGLLNLMRNKIAQLKSDRING